MQRELKVKLGWSDANKTVQQFTQLVKRRFTRTFIAYSFQMQSSSNKIDWHLTSCFFAYFFFCNIWSILVRKILEYHPPKKVRIFSPHWVRYFIGFYFLFCLQLLKVVAKDVIILLVIPILSIIPTLIITIITFAFRALLEIQQMPTALFTYGIIYPGVTLSIYLFILKGWRFIYIVNNLFIYTFFTAAI